MTATDKMITTYSVGVEYRGKGLHAAWTAEIYGQDRVNSDPAILSACFEAGVLGHDMPRWVSGWRYGDIPSRGTSWNHRDNSAEKGVSIMAIDGDTQPQTDGTFELFNCDRPHVRIVGWLIGFRGSDGERLVVGAQRL